MLRLTLYLMLNFAKLAHFSVKTYTDPWKLPQVTNSDSLHTTALIIDQRFPTWGTCSLWVHLPIWRSTFKVRNWRGKYIYMLFISKYLYMQLYQWILFSKIVICLLLSILTLRHKNGIYLCSSKNVEVLLKFSGFLLFHSAFLWQDGLGVHAHRSKCWTGLHGQRKVCHRIFEIPIIVSMYIRRFCVFALLHSRLDLPTS